MKKLVMTLVISCLSMLALFSMAAKDEPYHEGFEYVRLVPPQPTQVPAGKIEVVELFWYGCPHCYRFEPALNKWLKNKPANVHFIRIPAQFRPVWELHARAYFVAQALQVEKKIHGPFFEEIHKRNNMLETRKKLRVFFRKVANVSFDKFDAAWDSFAINNRLKQAKALVEKYNASGVPTMIVNGKYMLRNVNVDGDHSKFIKVLNYLIAKEAKNGKEKVTKK